LTGVRSTSTGAAAAPSPPSTNAGGTTSPRSASARRQSKPSVSKPSGWRGPPGSPRSDGWVAAPPVRSGAPGKTDGWFGGGPGSGREGPGRVGRVDVALAGVRRGPGRRCDGRAQGAVHEPPRLVGAGIGGEHRRQVDDRFVAATRLDQHLGEVQPQGQVGGGV